MELVMPVPKLTVGRSEPGSNEACLFEALNMALTGELTDRRPDCCSPSLYGLLMIFNDKMPNEPRQKLWAYGVRALGTISLDEKELTFKLADRARIFASDAMTYAGLMSLGETLRSLTPITEEMTAAYAHMVASKISTDPKTFIGSSPSLSAHCASSAAGLASIGRDLVFPEKVGHTTARAAIYAVCADETHSWTPIFDMLEELIPVGSDG